ncbi:hypothetical protein MCJ35_14965 [Enterocloster sp. OA13]|uniref:hypothetical protein n=1 Tax=Enterocloster TaxID=2719313 RepID=UPI00046F05E5|nr:hypothetical protein [Lachnoclostridium pacaense]MCC2816031.1 hypothetical protein [Lachnoclostridium pacaense]MCH1950506.1 hypothetical protein [Enterocloster sp. OA13]
MDFNKIYGKSGFLQPINKVVKAMTVRKVMGKISHCNLDVCLKWESNDGIGGFSRSELPIGFRQRVVHKMTWDFYLLVIPFVPIF